MKITKVFCWF